ncbi:MAG: hemerythrin domain-containing protein, partial [Candidatus Heimdallarchaeota archaeon]
MDIAGPIRAFVYVHKAIRAELNTLANMSLKLSQDDNLNDFGQRINFLHEFVGIHAKGEEDVFYPAVDEIGGEVSNVFVWDHRKDGEYFAAITEA